MSTFDLALLLAYLASMFAGWMKDAEQFPQFGLVVSIAFTLIGAYFGSPIFPVCWLVALLCLGSAAASAISRK